LAAALGELFLVVEQVHFVDGDAALAAPRCATGFHHPAGVTFFAGSVSRADLDPFKARLGLLAAPEPDTHNREPAE
jgi:hypothetical protein